MSADELARGVSAGEPSLGEGSSRAWKSSSGRKPAEKSTEVDSQGGHDDGLEYRPIRKSRYPERFDVLPLNRQRVTA